MRTTRSYKDQLPGGLGDKATPEDVDPEQLKMGIEVEREHVGDDTELAKEIAIDHLVEIPDYYTRLKKMEDEFKKENSAEGEGPDENEKNPVREKIIKFIETNPHPDDDQIHDLAEQLGMEPDELETEIYSLLTDAIKTLKNAVVPKPEKSLKYIEGDDIFQTMADVAVELYDRGEKGLASNAIHLLCDAVSMMKGK